MPKARVLSPHLPRRAFTLIELLVVVAVIVLLVAILLPSLGRAHYQAKLATCRARLCMYAKGLNMYASENNNSFPWFVSNPLPDALNLWDQHTSLYTTLRDQFNVPHAAFFCPLSLPELPAYPNGTWNGNGTWNATIPGFYRLGYCFWTPYPALQGTLPPAPNNTSGYTVFSPTDNYLGPPRLTDPIATINPIATDIVFTANVGPLPPNVTLAAQTSNVYTYSQHLYGHGVESINAAWADGHVERVASTDIRPRFLSKNGYWDWR